MHYDNNKKFGLLQFHSGYGKLNLHVNSPKGYSRKIINAQTDLTKYQLDLNHLIIIINDICVTE